MMAQKTFKVFMRAVLSCSLWLYAHSTSVPHLPPDAYYPVLSSLFSVCKHYLSLFFVCFAQNLPNDFRFIPCWFVEEIGKVTALLGCPAPKNLQKPFD